MELKINDYDLLDIICLCHAGLAQDSPELPEIYFNKILGLAQGYLPVDQRKFVEEYLAEKKYLPPVEIYIAK
jgi:hypothetical protein